MPFSLDRPVPHRADQNDTRPLEGANGRATFQFARVDEARI